MGSVRYGWLAGWMDGVMASYLRLLVDRDVVVIRDGQPEHTRLRGGWMAMTARCRATGSSVSIQG
jgi:hypothetical protein